MVFYPKYPQEVFDFIKESKLTGKNLRDEIKQKFGCSGVCVCESILRCCKCKGHRFEYLEDWQYWTDQEKEKWTRKNNIYFMKGAKI